MSDLASRRAASASSYARGWATRLARYGRTGRGAEFEPRAPAPLTPREREIRDLARRFAADYGRPPSRRELQSLAGTSSRSHVDRVVAKLKTRREFPR